MDRFMQDAYKFDKITKGKTVPEIEKLFWKSLFNNSPLYGADVAGSLFDKNIPWNLAELKTILNRGLEGQNIPGVSNPYVYVGQWKSMFGWHKEDLDLYSINYLHSGASKFWYGIDLKDTKEFERFLYEKLPESRKRCPEFIRHKTTLVHPKTLVQQGFKMVKALHNQGEFIVSRASAYHQGFNFGFNIAEAVNFAVDNWLKVGCKTDFCRCTPDTVNIDFDLFYRNLGLNVTQYMNKTELSRFRHIQECQKKLKI